MRDEENKMFQKRDFSLFLCYTYRLLDCNVLRNTVNVLSER